MSREDIKAELEALRSEKGSIIPKDVVDRARDPDSPLHDQFTWDDSEAAEQWRIEEARKLIRVFVTVLPSSNVPIRTYVSLTPDRAAGVGYRIIDEVLSHEVLRAQMLEDALSDLRTFELKYARLAELKPVMSAIEKVRRKGQGTERRV
jgi:hypothetical protein